MHDAGGSGAAHYLVKIWRRVRWPLGIIVLLYVALVIYRIPAVLEQRRTAETIDRIQAQRLTPENVDGKHLPPPPDPAQVDATIEGVDANGNGIRDDVELAIFEKYPNSPYTRAAELQYAMALQMYLTEVFNSETWKIAAEQKSRGSTCLSLTYPRDDLEQFFKVVDARVGEVDDLMLNTAERRDHYDFLDKYTTSFGLNDTNVCDLDN
ncbi:MAG: hypothetical protein AAB480_01675 [Patescibacteria group bacterium]